MDNDDFIKLILIALACPLALPLMIEEKEVNLTMYQSKNCGN